MPGVTYIVSRVNHSLGFQMVAEGLKESDLSFILLNNSDTPLERFLKSENIPVKKISVRSKFYLIMAFFGILIELIQNRPQTVHCHNRFAYLLGIPASWLLRIRHRLYTRHHSTLQHQYYPSKVKYDKLINNLSTRIIAVSQNVKEVLVKVEGVEESKISLIHHGFYLEKFSEISNDRIEFLRAKYLVNHKPVVGVISRFINWKGVEYIIEAFSIILQEHPSAILLLANASGPYEAEILKALENIPTDSYRIIKYEEDIFSLYQLMNVFVHTPIDPHVEAFGQIYVEALASSVPSVFSLSGVASEFIEDRKNALVVDYKDPNAIAEAILEIMSNNDLKDQLIHNGLKSVEQFSMASFVNKLKGLYHGE